MIDAIDDRRIRRAFDRAAAGFAQADFLNAEIRERLLDRLSLIELQPERIIDLGSGLGMGAARLAEIFPASQVLAVDSSTRMLAESGPTAASPISTVCADARRLPVGDKSIDLIFSNLLLPHCPTPVDVLIEAKRILGYPGVLTFTTVGPGSLSELRRAWSQIDEFDHVAPFIDMHDLGDALVQAGFAEPVMSTETIRVTYPSLTRAVADLKGIGSINSTQNRNRGLTGRRTWQRLAEAYEQFRDADGKLPVSLEVIYGLAWSSGSRGHQPGEDFEIRLDEIGSVSRG